MTCRSAAASVLLVAAGWAVPAAAVTGGSPPLGTPAAVENGLVATATGEVLYDSNILRVSDSALLTGGRHRDDFRYSPSGVLKFDRNVGRLTVAADGLIGHDFFQYNTYLSRNHFAGDGTVTYHAGTSCEAAVNGSYSSRQAGIFNGSVAATDPTGNPDSVGAVIDNVQDSALYGVNAHCGSPSGRLSFGGGYTRATLRNGSAVRKFSDSNSDTFSGNIGVGILRPGQVSLTGSYSTISYPGRALGIPGIMIPPQFLSTGVHTYRVGITLTRPIGTRLNGTFGVSYLHAEPTGGQSPYSSPAYNVALYYNSSSRLSFGLVGLRDIISSSTAGALFRVVDQAQLSAQYDLGEAITIGADVGLIRNDFKQSFALVGEPLRRNEVSKTAGVNVTYQPRRLYDVSLGVIQTIRTADPNVYNYNSTKVSLTLAIHI